MFLGHFGVAFASKRAAPRVSLGVLVGAAQLLDLIWPILLLAGVESASIVPGDTVMTPLRFDRYPISHSLLTVIGWALLFGGVVLVRTRSRRAATVVALLVASHWVLDLVVHRPDLPLYPGGPKLGLGLWNSLPATLVIEIVLFLAGVVAYSTATRARDGKGRWGWLAFVALLAVIFVANSFGPPPPSMRAVAWACLALYVLLPFASWVDAHRAPVSA